MEPEFVDLEPLPALNIVDAQTSARELRKVNERIEDTIKLEKVMPGLRLNNLTLRLEYGSRTSPQVLQGDDIQTLTMRLAVKHGIFIPEARVEQVLRFVAKENAYCPIQRYLMDCSLEEDDFPYWDDLSTWMLGRDDAFATSILQRFLIGAVARGCDPGVAMDWMPILIGKQGCGKSQICRELVPETLYGELTLPLDILMKEMYRLHSAWILEMPEVDNYFKRQNIENFKNVVSVKEDRIRKPYQSEESSLKRRVVFIGSSNRSEFLLDETGNRRFIPLEIKDGFETPWREMREIRNLMWKRAVTEYKKKVDWFIESDELEEMQKYLRAFTQTDPWEQLIASYIEDLEETTISDVMMRGLSYQAQAMQRSDQRRVSAVLTSLGWRRMLTTRNGRSVRIWKRAKPIQRKSLGDF